MVMRGFAADAHAIVRLLLVRQTGVLVVVHH